MLTAWQARQAIRRLVPNPQTITLRVRDNAQTDGWSSYTVANCGRREPGLDLDGEDPTSDDKQVTRWTVLRSELDAASVPAASPVNGDIIADSAGDLYTIAAIKYVVMREALFITTTNLR